MMISARLDDSAAAPNHSQAALAALLEDGVTGCTAMLTSPHAAFSMAATARMFYLRARFYTRQREVSNALTDLAFAHSLNPLDDEVWPHSIPSASIAGRTVTFFLINVCHAFTSHALLY